MSRPSGCADPRPPCYHGPAGTGEAAGANVIRFQPDGAVFGWTDGADCAIAPEEQLAPKTATLCFKQARAVFTWGFASTPPMEEHEEIRT